jgi:hypothetical protein
VASGVCTYVRVPRAGRRIAAGSTAYVVRTSYVTYVSPLAWRRWQSNSDRPIDPLNLFFSLPFGHGTGPPPHTTQHLPALRLSCPRSASRDHRRTGTLSASPLIHQQQLPRSDTTPDHSPHARGRRGRRTATDSDRVAPGQAATPGPAARTNWQSNWGARRMCPLALHVSANNSAQSYG